MGTVNEAARLTETWARDLAAWAIPQDILDEAPESPYGFPREPFERRGERRMTRTEPSPTTARALEALGEGGTVLDVGAGGGATSLPLAGRCTGLTAVDGQADMLDAVARGATAAGIPVATVLGRWPDVAAGTPEADVVVCGHVVYNVPDLDAFLVASSAHARRRVVFELTELHPLTWMNDLWERFHGARRPDRPAADDVEALCRALGFPVRREDRLDVDDEPGGGFARRGDAIALVRRRLCLPADRDDEIADALGPRLRERDGTWSSGPREQPVVTLWWDTAQAA
jgi:precorrin-6B methylase 2